MLSDDWQLKQYHKVGNDHSAWMSSAEDLLAASRMLRKLKNAFDIESVGVGDTIPDEGRIHPVELMLRGFAVECLLKALWVKQGGTICSDGEYVGVLGAGDHDLLQLCNANKLTFSQNQRDVLKRLSVFMTSIGRYPIASHWRKTKIQSTLGGGKGPPTYWVTPSDDEIYDSIVKILHEALDS
ncbi:MAG: hypothetical protein Q8O04_01675 [Deltaproteobacteria bacterium]|nr:hypothetical protein [Deltaproteobacteria bacterium]